MIMKRIQLLYMLFLPLLSIGQQYTVTKNYVVVKKYLDPTTSIASPRTTFDMTYLEVWAENYKIFKFWFSRWKRRYRSSLSPRTSR